jgi:hypothetical protein
MSAYVIVEASVRDEAARERCSSQVGPVLRANSMAKFLPWDPGYRFLANPHSRTAWSFDFRIRRRFSPGITLPTIKALLELRDAALDCRFRVVGS